MNPAKTKTKLNLASCFLYAHVLLFQTVLSFSYDETRPRLGTSGGRLHEDIIGSYNKYILPVKTTDHNVDIRLLLRLVQLTDIVSFVISYSICLDRLNIL